ncbi:MAG: L-lactate dehydrogenase [Candidatus Woesearchaeota archaeon]
MHRMGKVAIIGCGFVGSTAAYAMMIRKTASEIAVIDINREKARGEAMDLEHGIQFVPGSSISFGDSYELCKGADVVVITAGVAQKKGETRLQLVGRNAKIFKEMIPAITEHNKDCVILIVTNPVDIMTALTLRYSGFPKERVFGTGTTLDSARLRYYLGEEFKVNPQSVHAYMMGEHGDTEFPVWSKASIGGQDLQDMEGYSKERMDEIYKRTKNAAYEIISSKGATYYAIGLVITEIVDSIINNKNKIFPVSTMLDNYYDEGGVCLSMPCVVGKEGIKRRIQLPLSEGEQECLHKSAGKLREVLESVED